MIAPVALTAALVFKPVPVVAVPVIVSERTLPTLPTATAPRMFTPSTPLPRSTTLPRVDAIVPWA